MLQHWSQVCMNLPFAAACGIPAWKAALLLVGLPGVLMALVVFSLKDPVRVVSRPQSLGRHIVREFSASIPPFTFLATSTEFGAKALIQNLILFAASAAVAAGLGYATGDWVQWVALGIGFYSVGSWTQMLRLRDRPLYALTLGCPVYRRALGGMAALGCMAGTVQFWAAPYAMREFHLSPSSVGGMLGAALLVGNLLGLVFGGVMTDILRRRDPRAPFILAGGSLLLPLPFVALMFTTGHPVVFVVSYFLHTMFSSMWGSAAGAFAQDMVLPRMRGTSAACTALLIIVITLAIGPYWSGKISTMSGSLSTGVLSIMAFVPLSAALLWSGARMIRRMTPEDRIARAAAHGEPAAAG